MSLIETRGLAVARGGLRALENLSFSLDRGQALILRGANGIGKTTLLRTLAGLQPPSAGEIIAGPDLIAYGAHADGLKTALSVQENLAFWARLFGRQDIAPALDAMALVDLAARPAGSLSAGQKRRLGLARLIVTGRPLWILDEPTVSLDADSVAMFGRVIRAHLAQGGAAIMATHIDLGLPEAQVLDLTPFRAVAGSDAAPLGFNEAFA